MKFLKQWIRKMTNQKKPKGFELHKCYEHMGGSKIHTIALAEKSEMWIVDSDKGMLIAEGRDGSLIQIGTSVGSSANWYEINRKTFIDDTKFTDLEFQIRDRPKLHDLAYDYHLRIYENGVIYLFNFIGYYDDCGLLTNLVENNSAEVLKILKNITDNETLNKIERMLFERI